MLGFQDIIYNDLTRRGRKGPKLNTVNRFYIYDLIKRGLQMNDTFADIHSPIFDTLIKTHTHITLHLTTTHTNPLPTHTNTPHTV
jgi:hypothetical protein